MLRRTRSNLVKPSHLHFFGSTYALEAHNVLPNPEFLPLLASSVTLPQRLLTDGIVRGSRESLIPLLTEKVVKHPYQRIVKEIGNFLFDFDYCKVGLTPVSENSLINGTTYADLVRYPIGSAVIMTFTKTIRPLSKIFGSQQSLINPNITTSFCPFYFRSVELHQGRTSVKQSKNLAQIYDVLSQYSAHLFSFTYSEAIPAVRLSEIESYFAKQIQYIRYSGRAPIENGSYYFGTTRRGGVLGDIFIDLDSEEFGSSKKKLEELKSLELPRCLIVAKFVEFFRDKILDDSPSICMKLKMSQDLLKAADIIPLSSIVFLGHGDCRPHGLAVAALLNHAGITCEYANFKEIMQSRDRDGKWSLPFAFDHSVVLYTGDDGKQYIADSYFDEFTNLPISSLMIGIESKDKTKKYQFLQENPFPTIFVKNPIAHYNNTTFCLKSFGENGGISLVPRTHPKSRTLADPSAIRDLGTIWDLRCLERSHSPVKIGTISNRKAFTTYQGIRILDMPIRLRGESQVYKLPSEIKMFQETIQTIIDHAHTVLPEEHMKASNCYLTIDQSWVEKGTTQRKPGIHTDGFQGSNMFNNATINHGYIVSNLVPTAFYTEPFYFGHLDPRVHNYFSEMDQQGLSMTPLMTDEFDIYLMTAYSPHAATIAQQSGYRTFLRIIYDKDKYNRYGNSINRLLDYQWEMIPNTNITRIFQYLPPSKKEAALILKIKFYIEEGLELNEKIINETRAFYEILQLNNIQEYYNFVYRIFSLDSVQLSNLFLSQISTCILSDYTAVRLLLIPLGSTHGRIKIQTEELIYKFFQQKISEGKKDEISGLIYEITNDPRYDVNKEKCKALLSTLVEPSQMRFFKPQLLPVSGITQQESLLTSELTPFLLCP